MILHSVGSSIHCDPSAPFVLGVYIVLSGPSARIRASSKHPSARWMCEASKILFDMVYRRATGERFCDARVDVADFTVRGTQRHGRRSAVGGLIPVWVARACGSDVRRAPGGGSDKESSSCWRYIT